MSVSAKKRAEVLPSTNGHKWSDYALRESIRNGGVLTPVLWHRGELLDGKRRLDACGELGIQCPSVTVDDTTEAARMLWAAHPRRAYERFAPRGWASVASLASLFGVRTIDIPTAEAVRNHRHARSRARKRRDYLQGRALRHTPPIQVEASTYALARAYCAREGITLSALLRGTIAWAAEREQSELVCDAQADE